MGGSEGAHVGWTSCAGKANTSSGVGGVRAGNRRRCRAVGSTAVLWQRSSPTPRLGGKKEGRLLSYSCSPSFYDRQIIFLLVISPVQIDCRQGSGKSVGTQKRPCPKTEALRPAPFPAVLHPLLPKLLPQSGRFPRGRAVPHLLGAQPHGQASRPDLGHASHRVLSPSQG